MCNPSANALWLHTYTINTYSCAARTRMCLSSHTASAGWSVIWTSSRVDCRVYVIVNHEVRLTMCSYFQVLTFEDAVTFTLSTHFRCHSLGARLALWIGVILVIIVGVLLAVFTPLRFSLTLAFTARCKGIGTSNNVKRLITGPSNFQIFSATD